MTRRHALKMGLEGILVVGAIVATKYAFLKGHLTEADIQHFVAQMGALAVPGFILLTLVGHIVLAPPLLFIGSGALAFGSRMGALYSLAGITIGAGVALLLGRSLLKDFASRIKPGLLKKVDAWAECNGLALVIGLKLALFANPPVNYAAGLTSIRLRDYLVGSFLGLIPGVFIIADAFGEWMYSASLLNILVHPALLAMGVLRFMGVAMIAALVKWYGKGKLLAPGYVSDRG